MARDAKVKITLEAAPELAAIMGLHVVLAVHSRPGHGLIFRAFGSFKTGLDAQAWAVAKDAAAKRAGEPVVYQCIKLSEPDKVAS